MSLTYRIVHISLVLRLDKTLRCCDRRVGAELRRKLFFIGIDVQVGLERDVVMFERSRLLRLRLCCRGLAGVGQYEGVIIVTPD